MESKNLTPEQLQKAKACKSPDEVLELAKNEGIELSDEDLEGVSGGWTEELIEGAENDPDLKVDWVD